MNKKGHFKAGLFVLGSLAVLIGALLWIGTFHFFQKVQTYETFFSDSVGIKPGSSVKYLGVKVGRVKSVKIAPEGKLIEVVFEVQKKFNMAGRNFAVQSKMQGLAGKDYLALTEAPQNINDETPHVDFATRYPIIPSRRGQMAEIEAHIESIYKKVISLDLDGLVNNWKNAGHDADSLVKDPRIEQALGNVKNITTEVQDFTGTLDASGTPEKLKKAIDNVAASANATKKSTEDILAQLSKLPPNSLGGLNKQVDQSMALARQDLSQLNQALNEAKELIESLKEEPGRIFTRPQGEEPFKK